jgi:hypothetical protein
MNDTVISEYGAVGGMRTDGGHQSTQRKPAPVRLCPPQIPHDLTWDKTQATVVASWQLTEEYLLLGYDAV